MIFLTYFVARRLVKVLDVIRGKLENISSGKLTGAVDSNVINRQDELGAMVRNANESMEKFGGIIKDSMSISQSVTDTGDRLKDMTDSARKATGQIADAMKALQRKQPIRQKQSDRCIKPLRISRVGRMK